MARRRTLLDTLRLLDTVARQHVPDYDESDVGRVVTETIAKAEARLRRRTRRIVPLSGQKHFDLPPGRPR